MGVRVAGLWSRAPGLKTSGDGLRPASGTMHRDCPSTPVCRACTEGLATCCLSLAPRLENATRGLDTANVRIVTSRSSVYQAMSQSIGLKLGTRVQLLYVVPRCPWPRIPPDEGNNFNGAKDFCLKKNAQAKARIWR